MKDVKRTLSFVWKTKKGLFFLVLMTVVIGAVQPFVPSLFSSRILDLIVSKTEVSQILAWVAIGAIATFLVSVLASFLNEMLDAKSLALQTKSEQMMVEKSLSLSYSDLSNPEIEGLKEQAELMGRTYGGLHSIIMMLKVCLIGVFSTIYSLAVFVSMFFLTNANPNAGFNYFYSAWSDITVLVLVIICAIASTFINNIYADKNRKAMDSVPDSNRRFGLLFNLIFDTDVLKDSRVYGMKDYIESRTRESMNPLLNAFLGMNVVCSWTSALSVIPLGAVLIVSYLFYGLKAFYGAISVGSIIMASTASLNLQSASTNILTGFIQVYSICHSMRYTFDFLELKSEERNGESIEKVSKNPCFEFHDVSFTYPGSDEPALDHVSFVIDPGQKLALVGRNGAGKSTIVKLLTRFYTPNEGYITIDGIDIRKFSFNEYQKLVSAVFQDYSLLAVSIGQNVAANENYDPDEVQKSLQEAGVWDKVKEVGLDTAIGTDIDGNGVSFSGGERQKIAIARALYKDSPLLCLDEPTAALDPYAEQEIYSSFSKLVKNKTAIFVSHRMSSTRFCDRILVIDHGKLVEDGTHESLMANKRLYFQMFEAQAQYYR